MTELGVRFGKGHQLALRARDNDGSSAGLHNLAWWGKPSSRGDGALIPRQEFQLSLVNGEVIRILVESFDEGFYDSAREDLRSLYNLALADSGISHALRTLEAVAGQGREWLAREKARRRQNLVSLHVAAEPGSTQAGDGEVTDIGAERRSDPGAAEGQG